MDHLNLFLSWETGIALVNDLFESISSSDAVIDRYCLEIVDNPIRVICESESNTSKFRFLPRTNVIYPLFLEQDAVATIEYTASNDSAWCKGELQRVEGDVKGEDEERKIGGIPALQLGISIYILAAINEYIVQNDLSKEFAKLSRNYGVLFTEENGVIKHQVVKGTDRPDLLLIDAEKDTVEYGRPYYEDSELGKLLDGTLDSLIKGAVYNHNSTSKDKIVGVKQLATDTVTGETTSRLIWGTDYADEPSGFEAGDAVILMKKAAATGEPEAEARLAELFLSISDSQCQEDALFWAQEAAEQDSALGMYVLGCVYEKGIAVGKDLHHAHELYLKAAEAGNVKAQFALGKMYSEGNGIKRDAATAFNWVKKAAEAGLDEAIELLNRLERNTLVLETTDDSDYDL